MSGRSGDREGEGREGAMGRIILGVLVLLAVIGLAIQAFPGTVGLLQVLIFLAILLVAYNILG